MTEYDDLMNSNVAFLRKANGSAYGNNFQSCLKPITIVVSLLLLTSMFSNLVAVIDGTQDSILTDSSGSAGVPDTLKTLLIIGTATFIGGCAEQAAKVQEDAVGQEPDPYGTKIYEQLEKQMAETPDSTNNVSYPAVVTPIDQLGDGYDDGLMDTTGSRSPSGHAVYFFNEEASRIRAIQLYSCRYDEIDQGMTVELWDEDLKTIYSKSYDYEDHFQYSYPQDAEAKLDWVTITTPDVQANGGFYVVLFTNSFQPSWAASSAEEIIDEESSAEETYVEESNDEETSRRGPPEGFRPKDGIPEGGILIGLDTSSNSGNSYVANQNPNSLSKYKANWMIRVLYE